MLLKETLPMSYSNNQLNEHLNENDLKWLVTDSVLIDMHKTKLGDNKDYVVLSIAVKDKTPAHDLARFIENSVHDFEDIEVSAATDSHGRYLIYVELKRTPDMFTSISGILKDTSRLSGIDSWKFKTMSMDDYVELDQETFSNYVITDPVVYDQRHPEKTAEEIEQDSVKESIKSRFKFLLNY